jgi:hypothetical protein
VQKSESGSACAPQEEHTGRVTVTAAEGCAAAGIGFPHDVQKLADSSTSLPQDVQTAISGSLCLMIRFRCLPDRDVSACEVDLERLDFRQPPPKTERNGCLF